MYSRKVELGDKHVLCEELAGKKYGSVLDNKESCSVQSTWIAVIDTLKVPINESVYLLERKAVTFMECGSLERHPTDCTVEIMETVMI